MKLKTVKPTLVMTTDCPGLLTSRVEYHVEKATATLNWLGPKIDKIEWAKVLAFFKWTNETAHSESQVRFYINMAERRWAAWAFPQKANTGMSAQELDTPDAQKQREQFPDGIWQYFMTVHHHCSGGAFQSSTDERNEHDQDGLHLTIGMMHAAQHDMHARFYLAKNCYEPDMSLFWDIGDVAHVTPQQVHDVIARYQMCRHIEAEFPQQWRDNYIEVKGVYSGPASGPFRYDGPSYGRPNGEWVNGCYQPYTSTAPQTPKGDEKVGTTRDNPAQDLPLVRGEQAVGTIAERTESAYNALLEAGWKQEDLFEVVEDGTIGMQFIDPQLCYDMDQVMSEYEINTHQLMTEIAWHRKVSLTNPTSSDKEHDKETRGDSDPPERPKFWWEKGEKPPAVDHGKYPHNDDVMMD